MKPTTNMLSEVFQAPIRLMVPLYQRPYVWEQEQERHWQSLWEDVEGVLDRRRLCGEDRSTPTKTTVLGMVGRGDRIRFRVIASRHGAVLSNAVVANVNPDSIIFTYDWASYKPLKDRYIDHKVINHSAGVYVRGDVYTNTIEGRVWEHEDRDARRLQEDLTRLPAVLLGRVLLAPQRRTERRAAV